MKKSPTDVDASVRARLLALARDQGEDFQLLLTRYANERLLFRLSASGHAQQFVLKLAVSPAGGPAPLQCHGFSGLGCRRRRWAPVRWHFRLHR